MLNYALKRLLLGLGVIVTVSVLSFVLVRLSGDVATMLAGQDATAADVEAVQKALKLDRPLSEQYADWAWNALSGRFGNSLIFPVPVIDLIAERAPVTFSLAFGSLALALLLSIPLAVLAAVYRDTWIDRAAQFIAALGQAAPTFFLGLLLILVFAVHWRLLPIAGNATPQHFVLPIVVLAIHIMPAFVRVTRASMAEVLDADYMRTARAKGLHPLLVVFKHGLRNAVLPVVSLAAVQLGGLLEGAIIVETVFALDGLGMLAWQSVGRLDFMVIQALVFWATLVYVVLTIGADLLNAWLNPRLRDGLAA